MTKKVRPLYIKWENKKKSAGRNSGFSVLEDKLLCLMLYYKNYVTHNFLGYLFNLHNSNICRMLKILEPMLAKVIHIKKDRTLTQKSGYGNFGRRERNSHSKT